MSREIDQLEHLFSRELDGQTTPDERELLDRLRGEYPHVAQEFAEYERLDRAVGDALRAAVGKPRRVIRFRQRRGRLGRGLIVAAAAGIAAVAWLGPQSKTTRRVDATLRSERGRAALTGRSSMPSWFAPPAPQVDTVEPMPAAYVRPELRVRGTQRDWILIPGRQRGMFFVVEIERVGTQVFGVHQDF